jgi:hypothetical protein
MISARKSSFGNSATAQSSSAIMVAERPWLSIADTSPSVSPGTTAAMVIS